MSSIFDNPFQDSLNYKKYNDLVFNAEEEDKMLDYLNGDNAGPENYNFSESDIFSTDPQQEIEGSDYELDSEVLSADAAADKLAELKQMEMESAYMDKFDRAALALIREDAEETADAIAHVMDLDDAMNGKDTPIVVPKGAIVINDMKESTEDSPEAAISDDIEDDLEDYGIVHDVEADETKKELADADKLADELGNDGESDDDIIDFILDDDEDF